MADWVNITNSQVDPDAPLTSELAYAWRDNPIAIAEGALGAPRILARARKLSSALITAGNGGVITYIGLDGIGSMPIFFNAQVTSQGALQVAVTSDGGSTWTGYSDMSGQTASSYSSFVFFSRASGLVFSVSSAFSFGSISTYTIATPATVNGIRVRHSGATSQMYSYIIDYSGTT